MNEWRVWSAAVFYFEKLRVLQVKVCLCSRKSSVFNVEFVMFFFFYPFQSSAGDVADVVEGTDLRLNFELQLLVFDLHVSTA